MIIARGMALARVAGAHHSGRARGAEGGVVVAIAIQVGGVPRQRILHLGRARQGWALRGRAEQRCHGAGGAHREHEVQHGGLATQARLPRLLKHAAEAGE